MKNLLRIFAFVFAAALASSMATPLLAQQDQNRDRDDQKQVQDQDRDQNRGDQDRDRDQNRGDRDRMQDRDKDRDHDRMSGDESAYYSNRYYKQGWQDGMHHKRNNKKFDNDDDRRAYEAGYMHGDRGEKWHNPGKGDHDMDHHDNDHDRR